MPSSSPHLMSKVIEALIILDPQSLLDVGAGFGKYGVLCREYLDYHEYPRFKRKIDAIEGFRKYLTPIHTFVYDKIFVGEARKMVKKLQGKYDLALSIDMLEDLTKEDGKELIELILKKSKAVLITIPKVCWNEKAEFGNTYEIFRSDWKEKEIRRLGKGVMIPDYSHYIYYIGPKEERRKLRRRLLRRFIKKILYGLPFATAVRRNKVNFNENKAKTMEKEWEKAQSNRR